ncbi:unnamed protein product, partial [Amoebophrya sp. A25]
IRRDASGDQLGKFLKGVESAIKKMLLNGDEENAYQQALLELRNLGFDVRERSDEPDNKTLYIEEADRRFTPLAAKRTNQVSTSTPLANIATVCKEFCTKTLRPTCKDLDKLFITDKRLPDLCWKMFYSLSNPTTGESGWLAKLQSTLIQNSGSTSTAAPLEKSTTHVGEAQPGVVG